jgi:hypothetical protein
MAGIEGVDIVVGEILTLLGADVAPVYAAKANIRP